MKNKKKIMSFKSQLPLNNYAAYCVKKRKRKNRSKEVISDYVLMNDFVGSMKK